MEKVINALIKGLHVLLGLLLIVMVGVSVWNATSRYLFDQALLWADEAATFGLIFIAYLGAVISAWQQNPIRMDILVSLFPAKLQRIMAMIQAVAVSGLCGWVAYYSYEYTARTFKFGFKSTSTELPMWIIHSSLTIGFIGVVLMTLLRLWPSSNPVAIKKKRPQQTKATKPSSLPLKGGVS